MTGRGQANALTRATAILAALFFVTSLGWPSWRATAVRLARFSTAPRQPLRPGQQAPAAPQGGNVLEQLQRLQGEQAAPAAPAPGADRARDSRGARSASVAVRLTIRAGASGPLFLWMAISGADLRDCKSAACVYG